MPLNKIQLLLLLLPFICYSQDERKIPLRSILDQITKQHNAKFSLVEEEIIVYSLVPPKKELSLQEKLSYIEQRTRLKFELISNLYYSIYNDVRMDKPLCGYLLDAETGAGIENAEIVIAGKSISVSTDAQGYFTLPVLSPNSIQIRHLSYKTTIIQPADLYVPVCPKIYLRAEPVVLEEVVTQQYLATGISRRATGEIIVKPRKFGSLPGLTEPDVLQTMQQLPGVTSIDETVSNINVRGGTHDQNLFLWNGIRMFQTSHFYGLISAFNPLQATNITIYKNGSPAFYGESVSSVADISTHVQSTDSCYNAIAVDMINANFLSHIRLSDKDRIQVSGRRTYSDLLVTPTFNDYQQRVFQNTTITDVTENQQIPVNSDEDFYFYDLALSYQHKLNEQHELMIDGIGMQNNLNVYQHTAMADRNGSLKQENYGGGILIRSVWSSGHKTEVQGYISRYNLNASNEAISTDQLTEQLNTITDKGIRAKYEFEASPSVTISTGYQFNEVSVRNVDEVNDPLFSRNEKNVSISHALIGSFFFRSKTGLAIVHGGIRANYYEKFNLFIAEPRVTFSYALSNSLNFEVIGEQKSQTVSQIIDLQQDFLGIEKRRWVLANEDNIPVQRSSQASIGINYSGNGWYASAEAFYKCIKGITSDSQGFQNQFEFLNSTGNYTVTGTELLIQKRLKKFYSWISYSFNNNKYHFDGFVPPEFVNNFSISHALSIAGTYEGDGFKFSLGAKWRSGMPITEPTGFTLNPDNPAGSSISYDSPNSKVLPANFHIDLSVSKTWAFSDKLLSTVSCSIINILNRNNVINRYYRVNTETNTVESVNSDGLGRTPNLSIKLIF
jgi:hypothetical protein